MFAGSGHCPGAVHTPARLPKGRSLYSSMAVQQWASAKRLWTASVPFTRKLPCASDVMVIPLPAVGTNRRFVGYVRAFQMALYSPQKGRKGR